MSSFLVPSCQLPSLHLAASTKVEQRRSSCWLSSFSCTQPCAHFSHDPPDATQRLPLHRLRRELSGSLYYRNPRRFLWCCPRSISSQRKLEDQVVKFGLKLLAPLWGGLAFFGPFPIPVLAQSPNSLHLYMRKTLRMGAGSEISNGEGGSLGSGQIWG